MEALKLISHPNIVLSSALFGGSFYVAKSRRGVCQLKDWIYLAGAMGMTSHMIPSPYWGFITIINTLAGLVRLLIE